MSWLIRRYIYCVSFRISALYSVHSIKFSRPALNECSWPMESHSCDHAVQTLLSATLTTLSMFVALCIMPDNKQQRMLWLWLQCSVLRQSTTADTLLLILLHRTKVRLMICKIFRYQSFVYNIVLSLCLCLYVRCLLTALATEMHKSVDTRQCVCLRPDYI